MKKSIQYLLLIFLIVSVYPHQSEAQSEQSEPLTFAFITDVHINTSSDEAVKDLERTAEDINENSNISFVVITGDVTEFGSDEELTKTKEILDELTIPWYVIPGNHDTNWSESGTNSFEIILGHERFKFEKEGIIFLGTGSGPNMRMAPGLVPREDIVWLRSVIDDLDKEKPVIYFNHYPLDESLANWYLVTEELKKVNIQASLGGHHHRNDASHYEGIPGIKSRSNLRGDEEVGGYNLVTIDEDSITFTERNPGEKTHEPWHAIEIKKRNFEDDTTDYDRPSYDINDEYDNVEVEWTQQDESDIGAGIVATDELAIHSNTAGEVIARDIETGKQEWSFQTGGKIYSTPAVKDDNVVVASTDSTIYNLDARNGSVLWKVKTNKSIVASPVIDQNSVFIGSSEDKFRSIRLSDGELWWENDEVEGYMSARPLVDKVHVYFGGWENYFYAMDRITGKIVWKWSNGSENRMLSPAAVYPVKADGKIFIVAPDRYTTALDTQTGEEIWRSNKHKGRESIGISEDKKFVYTKAMDDSVFAYSATADSMDLEWSLNAGFGYEISPSNIVEKDRVVYVPTDDGVLYAIDKDSQDVLWAHKISNALVNPVYPLSEKHVLATTMDGKIIRLSYFDE